MKTILGILLLISASTAVAENSCSGVGTQERVGRSTNRGRYCMALSISFPWRRCDVRVCWNGRKVYPSRIGGVACGTKVACSIRGRGPRYSCRY